MRFSGKIAVAAVLGLGVAAGTFAVLYWQYPGSSTRWSFSQIHTSLSKNRPDAAARFLGPVVVLNGKPLRRETFLEVYEPGRAANETESVACPAQEGHWDVNMAGRTWCFDYQAEHNLWLLHRVSPSPCPCSGLPPASIQPD